MCVEYTEGRVNIITAKEPEENLTDEEENSEQTDQFCEKEISSIISDEEDLLLISNEAAMQNLEKSSNNDSEEETSLKDFEKHDSNLDFELLHQDFQKTSPEDSKEETSLEISEVIETIPNTCIDLTERRPLVQCHKKNNLSCQLCQSSSAHKTELLCNQCKSFKSAPKILASRSQEDWRGLTTKDENRKGTKRKSQEIRNSRCKSGKISKYLDKNQSTFDALSHEKLKKISIMKNGNCPGLKVRMCSILLTQNLATFS